MSVFFNFYTIIYIYLCSPLMMMMMPNDFGDLMTANTGIYKC